MTTNKNEDIFNELLKNEMYQSLLKQLPDDEQKLVKSSLRELVNLFENNVLNIVKNFKQK